MGALLRRYHTAVIVNSRVFSISIPGSFEVFRSSHGCLKGPRTADHHLTRFRLMEMAGIHPLRRPRLQRPLGNASLSLSFAPLSPLPWGVPEISTKSLPLRCVASGYGRSLAGARCRQLTAGALVLQPAITGLDSCRTVRLSRYRCTCAQGYLL